MTAEQLLLGQTLGQPWTVFKVYDLHFLPPLFFGRARRNSVIVNSLAILLLFQKRKTRNLFAPLLSQNRNISSTFSTTSTVHTHIVV